MAEPLIPGRATEGATRSASRWLFAAVVLAVAVLYAPVLTALEQQWWNEPDYSHGFLVPVFSAWVAWQRRSQLREASGKPSLFGAVLLVFSLAVLFVGNFGAELFLQRISLIGVVIGLLAWFFGWRLVRAAAFPLAFLLLMIPLPGVIYYQIVVPLQTLAAQLATAVLHLLHLFPVERQGNLLVLPSATLEVAEACSGIRSLLSLLTLAAAYAYLTEKRNPVRWLLCVLVVPIAVAGNAARVVFAALSAELAGASAVEGWAHTLSGILLFLFSLLLLVLAHAAITAVWPAADVNASGGTAEPTHPLIGKFTLRSTHLLVALLVLVAAVGVEYGFARREAPAPRAQLNRLPAGIAGWNSIDIPIAPRLVAYSHVDAYLNRIYSKPGAGDVSLYIGYYGSQRAGDSVHSPRNCLPGAGWTPLSSRRIPVVLGGQPAELNQFVVEHQGRRFIVLYWYQSHGRVVASEYRAKLYTMLDAMRLNRTDSALVRVTVPVAGSEAQASELALSFAQTMDSSLREVIPQ